MKKYIALILIGGCASNPVLRSDYNLESYGDLIASNSPTFLLADPIVANANGSLDVRYSVLVQNSSKERTHKIFLDQSTLTINEEIIKPDCGSALEISPGSKNQFNCAFHIEANEKNKLNSRDTIAWLRIPSDSKEVLTFRYPLRIEDFER